MWWPRGASDVGAGLSFRDGAMRAAAVAAMAAALAGCFQPMYAERSVTGGPAAPALTTAMASVDVEQIAAPAGTDESWLAVELRNDMIFALTGGASAPSPTHRLRIRMTTTRLSVIVDVNTARPDVENYGINAAYELVDLRTGKVVVKDQTFSRVSYDIPGQQQRFARQRGLRDAEVRAAQAIAENIRNRLASYFVAGT